MRPKDAATVILVRDRTHVLVGARSAGHAFMPNRYVFPGGGVDANDWRIPAASELHPYTASRLQQDCAPPRARALGIAAIRETYEETGLRLATTSRSAERLTGDLWRSFRMAGVAPSLNALHYFARAITPPGRPRRFDARFFLVDAAETEGELVSNGELLDLKWVTFKQLEDLPLPDITKKIVETAQLCLNDGLEAVLASKPTFWPKGARFDPEML
ncbi:MAG TPA: NUDIX hydrolase [Alphaproteobacteria bacterium]|nr:NUDIX hydrolase [Alphaproteobacteria bacterium]